MRPLAIRIAAAGAIAVLALGCGGQAQQPATPEPESNPTTEPSPTTEASPTSEPPGRSEPRPTATEPTFPAAPTECRGEPDDPVACLEPTESPD